MIVLRKNEQVDEIEIPDSINRIVRRWNAGDDLMYTYFLHRLEQKIDSYGRTRMEQDVQILRQRRQDITQSCIENTVKNSELTDSRMREHSPHVYTYELRKEKKNNKTCLQLVLPELKYIQRLVRLYRHNLSKSVQNAFQMRSDALRNKKGPRYGIPIRE